MTLSFSPHAITRPASEQSKMLDKIDALRAVGVGGSLELLQLVMIANMSDEKSTVLEAISRVRFPDKYNIDGCSATEIVLRRAPQFQIEVSIERVESKKSEKDRPTLRESQLWSSSKDGDLPALLQQAKERMSSSGCDLSKTVLSHNVLRIKISGPGTPDLTLVDLAELDCPTLRFQYSDEEEVLSEVATSYLKNTRNIFLAVISARFEGNVEVVLNMVKLFDSELERVLGVIAQPQKLTTGSQEEEHYLNIIKNEKVKLRLGWHVLCDRSFEANDLPHHVRKDTEKAFFDQEPWASLPHEVVGTETLRRRLSILLSEHIHCHMSAVEANIERLITDQKQELKKLGPERASLQQQRGLLLEISTKLQLITEQALSGLYTDDFFGSYGDHANSTSKFRRLRAVIRELNENFAEAMNIRGCRRIIQYPGCPTSSASVQTDRFNPYMAGWTPKYVDFATLRSEVNEQARHSRGTELPGAVNQFVVGSLFRDQAQPWKELAEIHLNNAWESANYFICQAIHHLADEQTYSRIVEAFIHPEMERLKEALVTKLSELTSSIERRHPLPVGKGYLAKIRKSQQERQLAQLKANLGLSSVKSVLQPEAETEKSFKSSDLERAVGELPSSEGHFEASEVIDQMQEYYDSAIVTFVDNVAMLAIENCLLRPLERVFTSQLVNDLSDERIRHLAAEQPDNARKRERFNEELGRLRRAKRELSAVSMDSSLPPPPPLFASQLATQTGFSSYAQSPSPFQTPITNQGAHRGQVGSPPKTSFAALSSSLTFEGSTRCSSTPQRSLFGNPAQPSLFGTSAQPPMFGASSEPPLFGTAPQPSLFGTPAPSMLGGASAAQNPASTTFFGN